MEIKEIVDHVMDRIAPMTTKDTYAAVRKFLMENGEEMANKIVEALPSKEEIQKNIEKCLQNQPEALSSEDKESTREVLEKIYIEGQSFGKAIGLSDEDFQMLYSLAYRMYNAGQYKDALVIFSFLSTMDRMEGRYPFGAGASAHMLKDYETAIVFYTYCTTLDYLNPIPWYHLADCYLELEQYLDAAVALEQVLSRTQNNKVYSKIHDKAQVLLNSVLKKVSPEK